MKVLVVGYGSIGKRHVKNIIDNFDAHVIICTKQKNVDLSKNNIHIVKSIEDGINQHPDIAFITNETSFHVKSALQIANKGIDLFIEKPLSNSMKDVSKLKKIVNKKKLITMIGCNLRFYPPIKKIKDLIERQEIGKILSVQVDSSSYLPDWHPCEDYRKGYAARKELGGGIVLTAIHELDYLHWIFGDVCEVFSVSEKISDLKLSVEDYSAAILKFENNVIAEVHLDFFQRPYFKSFKIKGTKGIITWNTDTNLVKVFNARLKKWKTAMNSTTSLLTSPIQNNEMYVDELKHFFHCVNKRTKTINDLDGGTRSLKTALALKKSSKLRRTISV